MIWFSEICSYLLSKTFKSPVTNFKPFNVLKVGFTLKLITVTFILRIKSIPVEVIMLDCFVPWLLTNWSPHTTQSTFLCPFLLSRGGFGVWGRAPRVKTQFLDHSFPVSPFPFLLSFFGLPTKYRSFLESQGRRMPSVGWA